MYCKTKHKSYKPPIAFSKEAEPNSIQKVPKKYIIKTKCLKFKKIRKACLFSSLEFKNKFFD